MDDYEKLKDLKDLSDRGLINELEFSKLKNDILFSSKNNEVPIKESENKKTPRTKEELNRDLANGLISGFEYNELCNELIKKSNGNSTEDHSAKFLVIILVIVGVLFFTFSINKSNNPNNNSAAQDTLSSSSSTPTIDNSSENTTTTCKICGRNFSGDGYDKIDGAWQRTSRLQTELCSPNCASIDDQRQTQKYNQILEKHGYAPINNSGHAQPNQNGYFTDNNGQLHQASPCYNCRQTGYVEMGDGIQACPMCNGKGEIIH
jgi:hypothetical protein